VTILAIPRLGDPAARCPGINRRELLRGLASSSLSLSVFALGFATAPIGCDSRLFESKGARIAKQIRAEYSSSAGARRIADAAGWSVDQAVSVLLASGSFEADGEIGDLRVALEKQIREDFVTEKIQSVDQWLLAETEIAIAVIVSAEPS
jgi:hypothetical protein